jgi:hypothetical protein
MGQAPNAWRSGVERVENTTGRILMTRYQVCLIVEFVGEIEADSAEEAEELAIYDETCQYFGVDSIDVREIEEEDEAEDEIIDQEDLEEEGDSTWAS